MAVRYFGLREGLQRLSFCAFYQFLFWIDCTAQKIVAKSPTLVVTPQYFKQNKSALLKEIPHQTEADHKITIRVTGCGIEFVSARHRRIEMFCLEENPCLPDSRVDKEI